MRLMCVDDFKKNLCHYCNTYLSEEPCEPEECWVYDVIAQTDTVEAVVLPCKLGDPVFIIGGKYRAGRFEQFINPGKFRLSDLEKMGKTVFLTREEAEAALAKMKGGASND